MGCSSYVTLGSVLAPLLFNIYTSVPPSTSAKKFIYTDNIVLIKQPEDFGRVAEM